MDEIRETISPEMKMQMELSVAIANRIYELLEEKGMSQKEFARLMGKTETEVSRWLSGTHNMTLATLCKISIALGGSVAGVFFSRITFAFAWLMNHATGWIEHLPGSTFPAHADTGMVLLYYVFLLLFLLFLPKKFA